MRKITKNDIEKLAKEIKKWVRDNKLGSDYAMLYNGKFWYKEHTGHFEDVTDENGYPVFDKYGYKVQKWIRKTKTKTEKNVDPHKYCEWFSEKFILGLCVDGTIYEVLNGYSGYKAREKLDAILHSYGLYLENMDGCHFEATIWDDNIEVEYTYWPKEKIVWLYDSNRTDNGTVPLPELAHIMDTWYELSSKVGDIGCCTIGEYMQFYYKGIKYRMSSQSPYQGDYSWSSNVDVIKKMLEEIGATGIYMNYGRMD